MLVALVCSVCDAFLVFVGVLGVATIFLQTPALKIGLGALGVAFLFLYGLLKLKEAMTGLALPEASARARSVKQTILTSLGFSLLNPHVYLDTLVLVGGYSAKFQVFGERFFFGVGASSFSTIWFFGLALLASFASRLLHSPTAMRIVSLLAGIILIALALKLGADVWSWLGT